MKCSDNILNSRLRRFLCREILTLIRLSHHPSSPALPTRVLLHSSFPLHSSHQSIISPNHQQINLLNLLSLESLYHLHLPQPHPKTHQTSLHNPLTHHQAQNYTQLSHWQLLLHPLPSTSL